MKKIFLISAWLLSAACALHAAEYPLWVANVQVTDDNKNDVLGDGTTVVSVRKTTITLMFNNADIEISGEGSTLNIQPRAHAFYMAGTGKISIGQGGNPITLNVTPLSNTKLSPFASLSSADVELEFYNINADIKAPANQTIVSADNGFKFVSIMGGITLLPEGTSWASTLHTFQYQGQALTDRLQMVAPAPEMQYEILASCDPAQGNAEANGMTTFSESQIYHMSGDDIMFETLNFNLAATPAAHYKFLGWVDVTNMVKSDDPDLDTPEEVIAMMKATWPELQAADPRSSVYEQLLQANASFDAETFYDYLFLYEPEDGHITFTAFFVQDTQDVEQVPGDQVPSTKECRDGVLYIVRDGKIYTAQGARVK